MLIDGFSRFIGDELPIPGGSTTTSAGAADGTTLIDTTLRRFGEDTITDMYLRPTGSTNQYAIRRVTSFSEATGTCSVAPAFAAQTATSQAYELHRYDPAVKFAVLDDARKQAYPDLAQLIYNDTTTADGTSSAFDIPSAIRRGPVAVFMEEPAVPEASWNVLLNPLGDSTTGYTASSFTASIYSGTDNDVLIPKYDSDATELILAASTAGTYRQTVGSMINGMTAALAAGREMTAAVWLYCRQADKIAVEFLQDSSAQVAVSSQHGGTGWELLTATGNVIATNGTTLTWGLTADNDANPIDVFWNRAWFYFGSADRVRNVYGTLINKRQRRDDTTQRIYTDRVPMQGRQLRMVGRGILSALGDTASTQVTNKMEVDEESEQILFAEAAKVLFSREGLNVDDFSEVATRIAIADDLRRRLGRTWRYNLPSTATLKNPWA